MSDYFFLGECHILLNKLAFFTDHQSVYIGVPVSRGLRRKRRRRRSSREAQDLERDRHYGHNRQHDNDRYRDIDIEEGLMDSAELSLQDINRTSKTDQTRNGTK